MHMEREMERGERTVEDGAEKTESLWEKLRREGKRGGHSTPAASFWRSNELCSQHLQHGKISSRKLAAAFWELNHYKRPLANIRRAVTLPPKISIESKVRNHELGFSSRTRTSTQLLKVLIRILGLEEQQESNMSLIKALKKDLDHPRGGKVEMDGAVDFMREKLVSERKLRKCAESLQRDSTHELYKVKASLTIISKELEEERMSRGLLEDLCDELACGVIYSEKELHDLRGKYEKEMSVRDDHDELILRMSQAWLDERMQVKEERRRDVAEKNRSVDKLSSEIEAFLHSERSSEAKTKHNVSSNCVNGGDSLSSTSDCFEVRETNESVHCDKRMTQKELKEKLGLSPLRLQSCKDHMVESSSLWRRSRSPVREWTEKLPPQNQGISESPLELLPKLKSALREKLLEARTGAQKQRSRQKASILASG